MAFIFLLSLLNEYVKLTVEVGSLFSSPEMKTQVSFSDQNCSVVRRRCRKFLTFLSSYEEPLGRFQRNLAHILHKITR